MFLQFLSMGKTMIELAEKGDIVTFKKCFIEAVDKELMFWHITKAFKVAVKHR